MSKARRHRRVTLIMRSGFPLWENPLVLSHHCRGLMYSRPIGITLDAAAIRPSSLWNCLTVSDWLFSPSWLSWGLTRSEQGTYVPASWSNPTPPPDKWISVMEKAHFSWGSVLTPTLSYEHEQHLDVEPPSALIERESTNRRCNWVCGCPVAAAELMRRPHTS